MRFSRGDDHVGDARDADDAAEPPELLAPREACRANAPMPRVGVRRICAGANAVIVVLVFLIANRSRATGAGGDALVVFSSETSERSAACELCSVIRRTWPHLRSNTDDAPPMHRRNLGGVSGDSRTLSFARPRQ